jgi:hypothetical protein
VSTMPAPASDSRLRGLARAARTTGASARGVGDGRERCDLCAEPLAPEHRHLLDVPADAINCACRACALLFDRQSAGGRHYRLIPTGARRLDDCGIDDLLWVSLGVPVDLAFFVRHADGPVTAGYPSPLGALRSTVDPQAWQEMTRTAPAIAELEEDVQALLVNRSRGAQEHWLVPLDDCYRLVALVRTHWKGLGGGSEVWDHVERFFAELSARD